MKRLQGPTVSVQQAPSGYSNVRATPEDYGAGVARAVGGLANTLSGVADVAARQQIEDAADTARDRYLQAESEILRKMNGTTGAGGTYEAGLLERTDLNATEMVDHGLSEIDQVYARYGEGLSEAERRFYDERTTPQRVAHTQHLSDVAARRREELRAVQLDDLTRIGIEKIRSAPGDLLTLGAVTNDLRLNLEEALWNRPQEIFEAEMRRRQSPLYESYVGTLAMSDPMEAEKAFAEFRPFIEPRAAAELETRLGAAVQVRQEQMAADDIWTRARGDEEAALSMAKGLEGDVRDGVERRLRTRAEDRRRADTQQAKYRESLAYDAVDAALGPGGQGLAEGQYEQLRSTLPYDGRSGFDKYVAARKKGEEVVLDLDRWSEINTLFIRAAQGDSRAKDEILNINPSSLKGVFPTAEIKQFSKDQRALAGEGANGPTMTQFESVQARAKRLADQYGLDSEDSDYPAFLQYVRSEYNARETDKGGKLTPPEQDQFFKDMEPILYWNPFKAESDDIDYDEQQRISEILRGAGIPVTAASVLEFYNREKQAQAVRGRSSGGQ